jgi:hypothetical protein
MVSAASEDDFVSAASADESGMDDDSDVEEVKPGLKPFLLNHGQSSPRQTRKGSRPSSAGSSGGSAATPVARPKKSTLRGHQ